MEQDFFVIERGIGRLGGESAGARDIVDETTGKGTFPYAALNVSLADQEVDLVDDHPEESILRHRGQQSHFHLQVTLFTYIVVAQSRF